MSDSSSSSTSSPSDAPPSPWQLWIDNFKWKDKLHQEATRKALDIPEDMEGINTRRSTTVNQGLGWREIATVGALGLGGWYLATRPAEQPAPPPAPAPAVSVPDAEYNVRFYDQHGNLIDVQPWPGAPPNQQE